MTQRWAKKYLRDSLHTDISAVVCFSFGVLILKHRLAAVFSVVFLLKYTSTPLFLKKNARKSDNKQLHGYLCVCGLGSKKNLDYDHILAVRMWFMSWTLVSSKIKAEGRKRCETASRLFREIKPIISLFHWIKFFYMFLLTIFSKKWFWFSKRLILSYRMFVSNLGGSKSNEWNGHNFFL